MKVFDKFFDFIFYISTLGMVFPVFRKTIASRDRHHRKATAVSGRERSAWYDSFRPDADIGKRPLSARSCHS